MEPNVEFKKNKNNCNNYIYLYEVCIRNSLIKDEVDNKNLNDKICNLFKIFKKKSN
jgi:hypothetical protein